MPGGHVDLRADGQELRAFQRPEARAPRAPHEHLPSGDPEHERAPELWARGGVGAVARIADRVAVAVGLIGVGDQRTAVSVVRHAVAVGIDHAGAAGSGGGG